MLSSSSTAPTRRPGTVGPRSCRVASRVLPHQVVVHVLRARADRVQPDRTAARTEELKRLLLAASANDHARQLTCFARAHVATRADPWSALHGARASAGHGHKALDHLAIELPDLHVDSLVRHRGDTRFPSGKCRRGVNEIDSTQFSCIVKMNLFFSPFLLFLQLGVLSH